jgi:hypothetical protein
MVVGEVFGKARVVREIPVASDDADEAAGAVTDLLSRVDRTRVWMTRLYTLLQEHPGPLPPLTREGYEAAARAQEGRWGDD